MLDLGITLNIAISLAATYLLLSIIASAFEEMSAGMLNSRGRGLKRMLGNLLGDPELVGLAKRFYAHRLIAGLTPSAASVPILSALIPSRLPSYIPKEIFADVICDILQTGNGFSTGQMEPGLAALWRKTAPDVAAFRAHVMDWFAAATDRQSGAYKRSVQRYLFVYGLITAACLNADTI